MRQILKISVLSVLLLLPSACAVHEALKAVTGLGGQSGGTQANVSVPIGDNKRQIKAGDEVKIGKTDAFVINNLNRYAPFATIIIVALFLIFLFLSLWLWLKRPPGVKQEVRGLEEGSKSKDYTIYAQAKLIEFLTHNNHRAENNNDNINKQCQNDNS